MVMSVASDTIAGVLGISVFDVTEDYAQILEDWYGEDLSLLDHDDDDLAAAVRRLLRPIDFWRTNPKRMTPYEKLRAEHEALIEQHRALLEEHRDALLRIKNLSKQHVPDSSRAVVKSGRDPATERRVLCHRKLGA